MTATAANMVLSNLLSSALALGVSFIAGYITGKLDSRVPPSRRELVRSVAGWMVVVLALTTVVSVNISSAANLRAAECQADYNDRNNDRVNALAAFNQRSTAAEIAATRANDEYLDALARYIGVINQSGQLPTVAEAASREYLTAIAKLDAANTVKEQALNQLNEARAANPPTPTAACPR